MSSKKSSSSTISISKKANVSQVIELDDSDSPVSRRKSVGELLVDIVRQEEERQIVQQKEGEQKSFKRKFAEIESDSQSQSSDDDLLQQSLITSPSKPKSSKPTPSSKPQPSKPTVFIKPVPPKQSSEEFEKLPAAWKDLRFDRINIDKISIEDMDAVLSHFEETKGSSLLYTYELNHLEKHWTEKLDKMLDNIVLHAVEGISSSDLNMYDIQEENRKWLAFKSLYNRIQTILINFERHCTTSIQLMKELTERSKARKEKANRQKDSLEREIANLPSRQQKAQLKFFVSQYGPLEGRRQFRSYEDTHSLDIASKKMAKEFQKSSGTMDEIIAKNPKMQAIAGKSSRVIEDVDDILDEKLI